MDFNANIEIDLDKLKYNVETLKNTYADYLVMFANVKNNAFGMGYKIIDTLIQNGVNYLYVSTLKEALEIRKMNVDIPILVNFEIDSEYIYDAIANNITITISDIDNLLKINELKLKDTLNIHLLIDNGSNKIGLNKASDIKLAIETIEANKSLNLEGIYTDLTTYGILDEDFYDAVSRFLKVVKSIKGEDLIVHLNEPVMYHKKHKCVNGIRFDISLLGIEENIDDSLSSNLKIRYIEKKYDDLEFPDIDLKLIFSIKAKVMKIVNAKKGSLIGKNYVAKNDLRLAIIPIGHKDGLTKAIGNVNLRGIICKTIADEIDYMIIEAPSNAIVGDEVCLINEDADIYNIIGSLKTNRFYLMSILNNNLIRNYINLSDNGSIL